MTRASWPRPASGAGWHLTLVVLDTLVLSQCLLPELKRHKLDIVSKHLGLPQFNHHRAFEDAMVARIMEKFIPLLRSRGGTGVCDIDGAIAGLRGFHAENASYNHTCVIRRG